VLDDAAEERIDKDIKAVVEDATDYADTQPDPDPATAQRFVYADSPPARMDDPLWGSARFMGDGGTLTGREG
jgi:TPP-dependent pyruvate/acetoin dehydrogenase alpha subunit